MYSLENNSDQIQINSDVGDGDGAEEDHDSDVNYPKSKRNNWSKEVSNATDFDWHIHV